MGDVIARITNAIMVAAVISTGAEQASFRKRRRRLQGKSGSCRVAGNGVKVKG